MDTPWLDRRLYPFDSRFFALPAGRMHYIDEGRGPPIVFVHGTPTWSFLYRDLISRLRTEHRCIAPDNLGFGLSDKPTDSRYSLAAHAANLAQFLDALDLPRFSLVVHDLGGPMGLSYALAHPERIERLVLLNTFMWPLRDEFAVPPVGKLLAGPIGRFLYLRLNLSPRRLMPMVYGDKSKLTPEIHRHYIEPFPQPADRRAMFAFVPELAAGATFCAPLWEQRARLRDFPALLLWGMKDITFGPQYLARWRELLPEADIHTFDDVGHFVQEEAPESVADVIAKHCADLVMERNQRT